MYNLSKDRIKEAYGSFWEHVQNYVDESGWCIMSNNPSNSFDMYYELNVGEIDYVKSPIRKWRPKILNHV